MPTPENIVAGSFGERLRGLRIAAGLSQEQLAERARMSVSAISALERGTRRAPYRQTITLLANALALNAEDRAALEESIGKSRARTRNGDDSRPRAIVAPGNSGLPTYLTSFVARERELERLAVLLQRQRLVTIVGLGGIGKTRLACEVARRRSEMDFERIFFVDLSISSDPAALPSLLAAAAGLGEIGKTEAIELLLSTLRTTPTLFVLDSCEYVARGIAPEVAAVLKACPLVTILATSRERLGLSAECLFHLEPLTLPSPGLAVTTSNLRSWSALSLFMDRATTADPDFTLAERQVTATVEICRRLDGIPLAIELAAARVPTLGLSEIQKQLSRVLAIPGTNRDAPERQQTMDRAIAWSYELLDAQARAFMTSLGAFVVGFSLEAAVAVGAGDDVPERRIPELLATLVEKSLVQSRDTEAGRRYSLLEPVRLFCLARREEAGALADLYLRHATWLAEMGDQIEARRIFGVNFTSTFAGERFEIDNVRVALERLDAAGGDLERRLFGRIVAGYRGLWIERQLYSEGRAWAERALALLDEERSPKIVAMVYRLLVQASTHAQLLAVFERAEACFQRVGDEEALGALYGHVSLEFARVGKFDRARAAADACEALIRREPGPGDAFIAWYLRLRAAALTLEGNIAEARRCIARAFAIAERHTNRNVLAQTYAAAAFVEAGAGELRAAIESAETFLAMQPAEADALEARLWVDYAELGALHFAVGDRESALRYARRALQSVAPGSENELEIVIQVLAVLAVRSGNHEAAGRLRGAAHRALRGLVRRPYEIEIGKTLDEELAAHAGEARIGEWFAAGTKMSAPEIRELASRIAWAMPSQPVAG